MNEITILDQKVKVSPELRDYLSKAFRLPEDDLPRNDVDEAPVAFWEDLVAQAGRKAGFEEGKAVFPQFHFPVQKGISQSPEYKAAILKGKDPLSLSSAHGLALENEKQVELFIHQSLAGKVPVLSVGNPHPS